jgi:hypothetical protein
MRKGIMALEELSPVDEPTLPVEGEIETAIAEGDVVQSEVETKAEQIDEATDIQEAIVGLADQAEESIAPAVEAPPEGVKDKRTEEEKAEGEGMSEETAAALEVAVEHFCKRLTYRKKVMPAMEGFADAATRKEKTKVALENLKELNVRLDKNIAVAQEGLVETITKSFEMAFATESKVLAKLNAVSGKYDAGTVKTENIKNPAWGKYLRGGSEKFTAGDAVRDLTAIEKLVTDRALAADISKLSESMIALTKEVRGNWFVSNKNDIERIESIHKDIIATRSAMTKELSLAEQSKATEFVPVAASGKAKLVKLAQSILGDQSLKKELDKFSGKSGALTLWSIWQSSFRLKGVIGAVKGLPGAAIVDTRLLAEDIVEARKAGNEAREIVKSISSIVADRVKICAAVVSYIEASV